MAFHDRFEDFKNQRFPEMADRFHELGSGQSPETLFITCSDSRIDPNLITQTEPGELFVIRNAGNFVPKYGCGEFSVEATIEYAVKALKVKRIIVCGHSHCGAVAGLLNQDSLAELPSVHQWVQRSKALLADLPDGSDRFEAALVANVKLQLEHLQEFPFVDEAIRNGDLELEGWLYTFETGDLKRIQANEAISN